MFASHISRDFQIEISHERVDLLNIRPPEESKDGTAPIMH